MALAEKSKSWRYALLTTVSSVLGGVAGYLIGMLLYDTVGQPVIELYGLGDYFDSLAEWYELYGIWVVLVSGFLPIPYKVFTIASGVFAMAIIPFLVGSAIGRGARFFAVSAVCFLFGDVIYTVMKKFSGPVIWILSVLLVIVLVYWTV